MSGYVVAGLAVAESGAVSVDAGLAVVVLGVFAKKMLICTIFSGGVNAKMTVMHIAVYSCIK